MATVAMATELGHMSMQMQRSSINPVKDGVQGEECDREPRTTLIFISVLALLLHTRLIMLHTRVSYSTALERPLVVAYFRVNCFTLWPCGLSAQVLDWIENHGEAFLSKHTGVGKSLHRARALQKRHEDFEEVAQVARFCFCNSHPPPGLSQYH